MFVHSPIFVRFRGYRQRVSGNAWWMVMVPGLALIFLSLAILIWPELLAYLVASVLLFVGFSLALWGWSMRQIDRRQRRQDTVYYEII
jgi:cobalamin biosynthesis protein CobD/CbiB